MRVAKAAPRLATLFPCFVASLLLSVSCRAQDVAGFKWTDASGAPLGFAQGASWPGGEEGIFGAGRQSNRYSLRNEIVSPPGASIVVAVRQGAARGEPARVRLSLFKRADGASPIIAGTFPLQAELVSIYLPVEAGTRISSLDVAKEGEAGSFSIESIAFARTFKGIEKAAPRLRVSAGFTLTLGQGYQDFSIEKPFYEFREPGKGIAEGRAGILIEYGPLPAGAAFTLESRNKDGTTRSFSIRGHPGGARTAIDTGILPLDTLSLRLRAPAGCAIESFYATGLGARDFALADLGRILLTEAPVAGYSLYRWDMLPSVLIFDFEDYATQDRYLKRLAFFVEKIGFRGKLARDEAIASLHGWNAHDYRPEDLAAFFRAARSESFPLNSAERELEGILLREGIIADGGGGIRPGKGAIISIARESSRALRRTFAVHESMHALFFSDADYRGFARSLWASMDREEKWFWTTYLGWAAYDVGSEYLMANEFQAYLLQQPIAAAEEYFAERKSAELLEKHPELQAKVDAYMASYRGGFAQRATQLQSWLEREYGIEAGRSVFLTTR